MVATPISGNRRERRPADTRRKPRKSSHASDPAFHQGESERQNSFDKVYRGILRGLYEGRFVPGQRLVEPDLMQQFEVARGTIREVLNRLSAAGIVTLVRHRGAAVRMLSRSEVNHLLDIVEALFGLAARKTTARIAENPDLAKQLSDACNALEPFERHDDFAGFEVARETFYRTVNGLSGNTELPRLMPTTQINIMRIQLRRFDYAADALQFGDYRAITRAILSGNADRAEAIARAHVRHTAERVTRVPDRAFAPERAATIED